MLNVKIIAGDRRTHNPRLLLRMRRRYVASISLDFHYECMERTERTLITRVWTICHVKRAQSTALE